MSKLTFSGRLAFQQRVLASYRVPFFDLLASACSGGMSLFAGSARSQEGIGSGDLQISKYVPARNIHLLRGSFYFCYQLGLRQWLADWNPEALIVEANPRYLSTPAGINWMRRQNRPVLGWGLGSPPLSGALAGFRQKSWARFLSQFDGLIAYSQRGADEYAALGFPRAKIFVAHNAVTTAAAAVLNRGPKTSEHINILFVGRLQARKRIDSLLRACAQMPDAPRLVIVGAGPEQANLEALAKKVFPSAEFVGARHGDGLKPYYTAADLFVLPGTGGLAVQEAMGHGLPIIVAKGDGTQDDLVRAENGWQVPAGDIKALVSTMRGALSDLKQLRKMGAESYKIVTQEINLEKMVGTFVEALNSVA
ncbi:MAG: glycosyltransferase [Anaerolineae bacterium]|nr:glycosyltransferase [Anaerolineae bacterium]